MKPAGQGEPWYTGLSKATKADDVGRIRKAVAEWADADAIAAHIAYGNDVFCTRDQAVSAGVSIFDTNNRAWLSSQYGVVFETPAQLAAAPQRRFIREVEEAMLASKIDVRPINTSHSPFLSPQNSRKF